MGLHFFVLTVETMPLWKIFSVSQTIKERENEIWNQRVPFDNIIIVQNSYTNCGCYGKGPTNQR